MGEIRGFTKGVSSGTVAKSYSKFHTAPPKFILWFINSVLA